jgi:exopolysaccharide biosynthesis polyprenyl glycosylphosphotransferase
MFRYGVGVRRTLLIGAGSVADRVLRSLSSPANGYRVDMIVDPTARDKTRQGIPVATSFEAAIDKLGSRGLDEIINADTNMDQSKLAGILNYATNHYISFRYAPSQFNLYTANSGLDSIGGVPMIEVRLTPLDGWGRILKRAFDVLGATVALIIFSPFMLIIALVIKITDSGPVLYRHKRVSRAGGRVGVMKFRTMSWKYSTGPDKKYKTAEEAFKAMSREDLLAEFARDQKVADDPRVSAFGRFLRRTSLDELPQFFNVLKGDMSLVGPRPVLPAELERYGEHGASFLSLKPGITGMWQVSGRNDVSYEDRVKLDVYYVENWSLWLDMIIIAKTVVTLLTRRGAY